VVKGEAKQLMDADQISFMKLPDIKLQSDAGICQQNVFKHQSKI
jgi:hypothetical protein